MQQSEAFAKKQAYEAMCSGQLIGAQTVRDTSPVEQAMNRLADAIAHAQTQTSELGARLGPVLVPRPIDGAKASGGQAGTVCPIEDRMNEMASRVSSLATQLREMREMLAI